MVNLYESMGPDRGGSEPATPGSAVKRVTNCATLAALTGSVHVYIPNTFVPGAAPTTLVYSLTVTLVPFTSMVVFMAV